ncbi:MAG: BMP family ABC transporter substrate-binding protein [Bacilli bacterium]|nr:BMP family ABC transporter substrate-binding protein [Bacilli bacterium]
MKKQILALTAMLAIAGLASCTGNNSTTEKMKVGLLTLHGEDSTYDKNFIDAFKAACDAKGVDGKVQTGVNEDAGCTTAADNMVDDGAKLIFADSFGHESHLLASAKKAADVQFCHATGTQAHTANQKNFHDAFASIYEGRYLAGVAAGMKLQAMIAEKADTSKKIGYVGAFPYAEVISGFTSYYLGVKSIVSDVTMEVRYTNSWYDENAEKTAANALIDGGCSIISQHADSWGAPTACEAKGVPNISYNGSTESQCPNTFVISSKINWQPYFEMCIDAVKSGKEIATDWTGTVDTESVQVTALGKKAPAAGTQEKLDEVKAALKAGTTKVFDTANFTVKNAKADTSEFSKASYITMDADGHLTGYLADVDDDGKYVGETEAIKEANGKKYFAESEMRSAPYFDILIDGISVGA